MISARACFVPTASPKKTRRTCFCENSVILILCLSATVTSRLVRAFMRGEPQPSEADIKVTRDLIRAGQLLKIEVLDHVIMGNPKHCSLRELGYFAA